MPTDTSPAFVTFALRANLSTRSERVSERKNDCHKSGTWHSWQLMRCPVHHLLSKVALARIFVTCLSLEFMAGSNLAKLNQALALVSTSRYSSQQSRHVR